MRKKLSFYTTLAGARRTRKRFLLFPKMIQGELRWLETATWEEEFVVSTCEWVARRWLAQPK